MYFTDNLNGDANKIRGLRTQFINNIIYGSLTRELNFDKKGTGVFVQDFQNNLIKSEGIDIHKETLELSRKRKNHDSYTLGNIQNLSKIYKPRKNC